jgi:hypothetical protein
MLSRCGSLWQTNNFVLPGRTASEDRSIARTIHIDEAAALILRGLKLKPKSESHHERS